MLKIKALNKIKAINDNLIFDSLTIVLFIMQTFENQSIKSPFEPAYWPGVARCSLQSFIFFSNVGHCGERCFDI